MLGDHLYHLFGESDESVISSSFLGRVSSSRQNSNLQKGKGELMGMLGHADGVSVEVRILGSGSSKF